MLRNFCKYLPVALFVCLGCGANDDLKQVSDKEYFPLRKGFYQIYAVEDKEYQLRELIRDLSYQLKTEVVDSFPNQEGGYTYTIHRSRRITPDDPWQFHELWSVRITPARVIVVEENTPFIKFVLPAALNSKWDGNALNNQEQDEYTLSVVGESYPLESGISTDQYIQITQEDSSDVILFMDKRKEVYARNVGLIYREENNYAYCTDADICVPGTQVIDHGTIYVQTLLDYGQN